MEDVRVNPSETVPLKFKIRRRGRIKFTITENAVQPASVSGWTWQLFVKRFPGDRKNIINLTLNNGLRWEIYSETVLYADFTEADTDVEEGQYYWELVRTDLAKTFVEGWAHFTFSK
mgnify:CR=1 FL=1